MGVFVMGDHRRRTSEEVMDPRVRPDSERHSLSRERCNSHASRRVPLETTGGIPMDHIRGSRNTMNSDVVGECWVQESCQGGLVQYCNSQANTPGRNTPSQQVQQQRNSIFQNQGAKEGQELYDSLKRAMEKKLRGVENRQSWNPVCKKEQEAVMMKPKEVHPIANLQMSSSPISTKDELLRVYRESIRRGELASLCMKTKKGRETLTLSVMLKSQESQNSRSREEAFDCYVPPETFPDYLPMCPKTKPDHDDAVQLAQNGVDFVKHRHH